MKRRGRPEVACQHESRAWDEGGVMKKKSAGGKEREIGGLEEPCETYLIVGGHVETKGSRRAPGVRD